MKQHQLRKISRVLLVLCGAALIAVLFVPVWRIELSAPQYPEGLRLLIRANGLGGDVAIVNGLNHYIGMKTLHTEDFVEFTLLPYIIGFFALLLFGVAVAGKKRWLNIALLLFVGFGVVAMADFWRWEYNYGHELNPDAAIVVPGMAYQPPLIGYKQLLNFGAYSVPGAGGWLFVGVGALLLALVVMEWQKNKRHSYQLKAGSSIAILLLVCMGSCSPGPQPIMVGKDHCDFCKMIISDNRFGAEIVTTKGRIYKFDDAHCILSFLQKQTIDRASVKTVYFTDFSNAHPLIDAGTAVFLKSDDLRSPMEGNLAAFGDKDSLNKVAAEYKGKVVTWNELYQ